MKKIIAIIAGGDSSEHDVSLRSAAGINSWLDRDKFIVYTVEISSKAWEAHLADGSKSPVNRHDFSFMDNGEKITPDYAYITIHGTPGEDGILQGYFDLLHIPYSTSNVLVEAMTFNKFALNQYLKSFGIRVADSMLIREGQKVSDEDVISHIGLPCFIKPNAGGSSFGVTKVKTPEQIQPAIEKAMKESPEVLQRLPMVYIIRRVACMYYPSLKWFPTTNSSTTTPNTTELWKKSHQPAYQKKPLSA